MSIFICDAIMGSGKSSAAITYMNEHAERRFIYITPYNSETERIRDKCPRLRFRLPSKALAESKHSKVEHTRSLIAKGCNISTTHQAFARYDPDMLAAIRERGYTLIIDEELSALTRLEQNPNDVDILEQTGCIRYDPTTKQYNVVRDFDWRGTSFEPLMKQLARNNLVNIYDGSVKNDPAFAASEKKSAVRKGALFYWEIPVDALGAFDDVIILTYLFDGQDLYYYFKMTGVDARILHVGCENGEFRFTDKLGYMPEYTATLGERIRIYETNVMCRIGEPKNALSASWMLHATKDDAKSLRRHAENFAHNIMHAKKDRVMWTTRKAYRHKIAPRGYTRDDCFVPMNQRASNEYKHKNVLMYMANVYNDPFKKRYFETMTGERCDDDRYGLSMMIQWIWRSAIRDGKSIDIYIPSKRMRDLLKDWIKSVEDQYASWASEQAAKGGVNDAA